MWKECDLTYKLGKENKPRNNYVVHTRNLDCILWKTKKQKSKTRDFYSYVQLRGYNWHDLFWKAPSPIYSALRPMFSYIVSRDFPLFLGTLKQWNNHQYVPTGSDVPSSVQSLITCLCDWSYPPTYSGYPELISEIWGFEIVANCPYIGFITNVCLSCPAR